jgi:hypothetical protein
MDQKQLDDAAKEVAHEAPALLRGEAQKLLLRLTHTDINKDGVSDLLQLINLGEKAVPVLSALNEAIDFEAAAAALAEAPFVKDKAKVAQAIKELGVLAEHAGALLPTKGG